MFLVPILSAVAFGAPFPERIVSLAPNLTEILYDMGVADRIAGVTDYCNYPPDARRKAKVGGFANPSLEAVVALQPDLVIMTEDGNPQALERRLTALGIKTYIFRARQIPDLAREIRSLGGVLGVSPEADRRARWIETRIRQLSRKKDPGSPEITRKGLFIIQPAPLIVAGKGTTIDNAFMILGIDNVGRAATSARYPKYSLEEVIHLAPDALFFGKERGIEERAKPLLQKLAELPAVRRKKVFFIDEAIYRLGPRIVSSMEEMASHLDGW
jgi:iron complex transport system substrate-binding protein